MVVTTHEIRGYHGGGLEIGNFFFCKRFTSSMRPSMRHILNAFFGVFPPRNEHGATRYTGVHVGDEIARTVYDSYLHIYIPPPTLGSTTNNNKHCQRG